MHHLELALAEACVAVHLAEGSQVVVCHRSLPCVSLDPVSAAEAVVAGAVDRSHHYAVEVAESCRAALEVDRG